MNKIITIILGIILGVVAYQTQVFCPRADVNCDGSVNVLDVQLVVNAFLDG